MKTVCSIRGLRKAYGRRSVLAIERLDFAPGERVRVIGANGSGKSTLLRILAGALPHDADRRSLERAPAVIGYVPQAGGLHDDLTLRRNLALRRGLYGRGGLDGGNAWYLDDLALTGWLDRRVGELSGGYRRLAALAAALAVEPDWLLLDEPFEGLDADRHALALDALRRAVDGLALLVVAVPDPDDYPDATRTVRLVDGSVA